MIEVHALGNGEKTLTEKRDSLLSAPVRLVLVLGLLILALGVRPAFIVRAQDVTVCTINCDYASIQAAVDVVSSGGIITVTDAVHTEGGITVDKSVTIRGHGAANTIVQAHAQPSSANSWVFSVGPGVTASILDMTIQNGNVVASSALGGGIHNSGTLVLSRVTVTANRARGNDLGGGGGAYGGAVYNDGSLTLLDSFINGNTAQGGDATADYSGAGSAYGGAIYNNGELVVLNSTMSNNIAQGGGARGLYGAGGDAYGGGIYNNGMLTIQGVTINGNKAQGGVIEGQYGYGGDGYGGGVAQWSSSASTVSFVNSTISGNISQGGDTVAGAGDAGSAFGGGIVHWWSPTSILDFVNCTISDNTAQGGAGSAGPQDGSAEGGGLRGSSGMRLSYCTVANNHVSGGRTAGGGLYSSAGLGGGPEIKAVLVTDNDGPANTDGPDLFGNLKSQDYNLIANPEGYTLSGPADNNIEEVSPLLGPLLDNGGPTLTHALLRESPAIDHVPSGKLGCGTVVREDQRSLTRPQGAACDVGAFERTKAGKIEVVKSLEPATDPGRFHLQIDGVTERLDASHGTTTGKTTVPAGDHTVGETAGSKTSLANYNSRIECKDGGGTGSLVAGQDNTGPLTVTVKDNDDIVCTIRNQRKQGWLEVIKDLNPDSDPGRFHLQIDGVTEKANASEGGTTGKKSVPSGSHTVGETAGTDTLLGDYDTRIKCRDSGGQGNVVATTGSPGPFTVLVGEDDDIVCTVRNERKMGQLEVIKDLEPATDPGKFDLWIDGTTALVDATDGGSTGKLLLPIGEHTVGEVAGSGTSLDGYGTSIQCKADGGEGSVVASADGAGPLTVMVNGQDDIVCTIRNERKTGKLKLVKDLRPTTDPGKFHLQIDGMTRKEDASHHDTTGKKTVFTGAHTVGEVAGTDTLLAAYASRIECRADGGAGAVVASGNGAGPMTVVVEENDLVVCTLMNTRRGTIVIQNQTNPGGGAGFGFTHDIAQPFSFGLDDGQAKEFAHVVPGTYTVRETDPTILPGGFNLGDLACLDGDAGGTASTTDLDARQANISLDAGEVVTCTFTNQQQGTITIAKNAKPKHSQSFLFTSDLGRFFLDDDGVGSNAITFSNLPPDGYEVSETVPQDWHLRSITCVDPDGGTTVDLGTATASIDLDPGEDITCTFEDLKRGSITIAKDSRPDGPQSFEFTGDLHSFSLSDEGFGSNSATFAGLIPGDYEITERVPRGWDLTDILCLDSDHGTVVDLDRATAFVDLDPDQEIRCTFENTQRGSITIRKYAQPRGSHIFDFEGDLGSFSLIDDGVNSNATTFTNLVQGDYGVAELVPPDWDLIGIACVDLDDGTTIDLAAALASIDLDPGEHVICTFENAQLPDLSLTKKALPSTVVPGQSLTYTVAFSNAGTGLAPNVVITDIVPGLLTQTRFQSDRIITPTGTVTYSWSVGNLAPGDGGVITLTGVISPALVTGATFTNTASMSTSIMEQNVSNSSDTARVTVLRLAPLSVDDRYSTKQNTPLTSAPLSVLDNDEALGGNVMTAALDGGPVNGMLALELDGTFVYTPTLDFVGVDTFTYHADDGMLTSNIAMVTVIITATIYYPVFLPTVARY